MRSMGAAFEVCRKELIDALRDRRTLLVVMLSGVLLGPAVLIALSGLIAGFEERAEQRLVLIDGMAHAPTLINFLQRQTHEVTAPPDDYERLLRESKLAQPVLRIAPDFETLLQRGLLPRVELVGDSANRPASAAQSRLQRLLGAFVQERAALALALRGVAPSMLQVIEVDVVDLAAARSRAVQVTGMLPFFVIMAVLYGALNAALDTTAGERERGSLEPLLMNPTPRLALVAGKWGAVALVAMLIALLSSLSFVPAQLLLQSGLMQALFQYGWREALQFLAILVPLAAALSAVLMAVAIRCRSFKEAQASSTLVVLAVSLLPLVAVFNQDGEAPWYRWTPALAQHSLMTAVLKGETLGVADLFVPFAIAAALTAVSLMLVARSLRRAALH